MAIIMILMTLFIPSYRRFSQRNDLSSSVQLMKEAVLRAQSLAYGPESSPLSPDSVSYYRFVFYPDEKPAVRYEIKFGSMATSTWDSLDTSGNNPTSTYLIDNYEKTIERGYLPTSIASSSGSLKTFGTTREGSITFQVINGACYYSWQVYSTPADKSYVFVNLQNNLTSSLVFNTGSCKPSIQ